MASHADDTWQAMWVTHGKPCVTMHGKGMPCVTMHGLYKGYIYGSQIKFGGRGSSFSPWEQQGGGGREKEKEERRREREEREG